MAKYLYQRGEGQEQPYWPLGPFKIRLPLVHYPFEQAEFVQAIFLFVVSLGMIPLLEQYLGLPYEVALAYVFICGIGFMLPALLGVPFVPGWITPAIPVVVLYLEGFEPGPEAIQALVALQLLVTLIFIILGVTPIGRLLVEYLPTSLKAGILLGAGIAALLGEIEEGGRLAETPISLIIGGLVVIYMLFSLSFAALQQRSRILTFIGNYGMVPGLFVAIAVAWAIREYPRPDIEWGFTQPSFGEMWNYLPFTVGFPGPEIFLLAIPTAIIAYVIAYGDIIVGTTLIRRVDVDRTDEVVDTDPNRVHLVTGVRNLLHSFFAPYPGLAGPIWTPVTATVAARYAKGRAAMESIFSGAGTFWIAGFLALFLLPLVSAFQPILPIALSLTLIITGYLCIQVGMEQVTTNAERGVAGVMGVVLAVYGAEYAIVVGAVLYLLVERTRLFRRTNGDDETETPDQENRNPREEREASKVEESNQP